MLGIILALYFMGALGNVADSLASIPLWVLVALGLTLLWLPWLVRISEDATRLVLVAHGGRVVSEWRLGRRVPLDIEGEPLQLASPGGAERLLVTEFNPESMEAKGTALEGATVFDLARDLEAFDRLAQAFTEHLRSQRLTRETVGIEVERRVSEYSDAWLSLLYGTLDPTDEIKAAMLEGAGPAFSSSTIADLEEALEGSE